MVKCYDCGDECTTAYSFRDIRSQDGSLMRIAIHDDCYARATHGGQPVYPERLDDSDLYHDILQELYEIDLPDIDYKLIAGKIMARVRNCEEGRTMNPETTLEELTRVREEQQVTRRALIALCLADDAHTAARQRMMSAPLHQAIDESAIEDRTAAQLKEAVTLCVELGRSLKAELP